MITSRIIVSVLYGIFVYFVAIEKFYLASIPLLGLIAFAAIAQYLLNSLNWNRKMPFWGIAVIFFLWIVAYLGPVRNEFAIPMGFISGIAVLVISCHANKERG